VGGTKGSRRNAKQKAQGGVQPKKGSRGSARKKGSRGSAKKKRLKGECRKEKGLKEGSAGN
jgi:hypothetical protein